MIDFRLSALALVAATSCALAQNANAISNVRDRENVRHALTSNDLNSWLDGMVPVSLRQRDIAGAEIVVVKDKGVLFEKGYGFADVRARVAMDPRTTLVRVASISKLFTWTAVMQQVELKRLDLDRDINAYLDFRIPATWPAPITLRNLMTHTAGFEDVAKNTYAPDAKSMPALGALLKSWTPKRIYPPGKIVAYSNYGAALAGYIVQRVSGEPFEVYVARHILSPLQMTRATFVQPLPLDLSRSLSQGYDEASAAPRPFELVELIPAGGLSTTADGIAHFMIADLNGGAYGSSRILEPATVMMMHAEAYQSDPALPGMALGFWHLGRNGHDIVAHTGDTVVFHSGLYLILDKGVGLFVAENSTGNASPLRQILLRSFMNRYYPAAAAAAKRTTMSSAAADGRRIAGTYESSRRSESNFMIVEDVFNESTIVENADNTISLSSESDANGRVKRWREIAPFRWQEIGGDRMLDAQIDQGRVTSITTDEYAPIELLMPVPFVRSAAWNLPLLLGTIAVLVLAVLLWPIGAIMRRRSHMRNQESRAAIPAYHLSRTAALVNLTFIGGWIAFFKYADNHVEFMNAGNDWILRFLQVLAALAIVGTFVPWYRVAVALVSPRRSWLELAGDMSIACACLAMCWFAFSLNLMTWSLNY
jgi:CubicO group peptidase (beta-lactamase class C family)